MLTLPNSQMRLFLPLVRVQNAVTNYPYADMGLIPDYEVSADIDDVITNVDRVKTFAIELIEQDNSRRSEVMEEELPETEVNEEVESETPNPESNQEVEEAGSDDE